MPYGLGERAVHVISLDFGASEKPIRVLASA